MIKRSLAGLLLAGLLAACGGGGAPATQAPGGQATTAPAGATQAPGGGGNTGDFATIAQNLVPPGSTEISRSSIGNSAQVIVSSNQSLQDLAAFYSQKIPALGLTETGRTEMQGTLIIALGNPDGGILVVPGDEAGANLITISVGTSS